MNLTCQWAISDYNLTTPPIMLSPKHSEMVIHAISAAAIMSICKHLREHLVASLGQQRLLFIVCCAQVHSSCMDVDRSCSPSPASICGIRNRQLWAGLPHGDSLIITAPDQRKALGYVFGTIHLCLPKQLTCLLARCHSYRFSEKQ